MSKKKDTRSKRHAGRYQQRFFTTARNKARRAEEVARKKKKWVAKGVKKNGEPVKK